MSRIIVLLGAPGSGKGTQASLIHNLFQLPHVSVGDVVRETISEKSALWKTLDCYVSKGHLVPDETIQDVFKSYVEKHGLLVSGFISDGFPRTISQARFLQTMISQQTRTVSLDILHIVVEDSQLLARLLERKRHDDTQAIIQERLAIYRREVQEILDFYADNVKTIDGNGSPEATFEILKGSLTHA